MARKKVTRTENIKQMNKNFDLLFNLMKKTEKAIIKLKQRVRDLEKRVSKVEKWI